MTIIPSVSENRKKDSDLAVPPVVALVWDAVLQLPSEPQFLLRVLLTKQDKAGREYDFEHPKASRVLAELAAHLKVTDRTVRNMVREALTHPTLQRAALGALPEIEVSRAGLDEDGRSTRAWSSQWQPLKGDAYRRSKHDRSRAGWHWCPWRAPNVPQTAWAPAGGPWTIPAWDGAARCASDALAWFTGAVAVAYRGRPDAARAAAIPSLSPTGCPTNVSRGKKRLEGTNQWGTPEEAPSEGLWRTAGMNDGRDDRGKGGAGLPAYVVGPARRVIPGTSVRWVRDGVRTGGKPGRRAAGYTYLLAGRAYHGTGKRVGA
jgi:hypothetical protein